MNAVYIMEKQVSITLGRPSAIQDFDSDFLPPILKQTDGSLFPSHVKLARLAGKVQWKLYSPEATQRGPGAIERDVTALEIEVEQWRLHHIPETPGDPRIPSSTNNTRTNHIINTYITYLNLIGTVKRARLIYQLDNSPLITANDSVEAARTIAKLFIDNPDLVLDPAAW